MLRYIGPKYFNSPSFEDCAGTLEASTYDGFSQHEIQSEMPLTINWVNMSGDAGARRISE